MKNIDETRNYFVEEIEQNKLMNQKHKKIWATLNYIEHFHILTFTVTRCISNSAFAFLLGIPTGIMSSAIGFRNCPISAWLKKYKSIINKKKKKHDKIGLLVKYHRSLIF